MILLGVIIRTLSNCKTQLCGIQCWTNPFVQYKSNLMQRTALIRTFLAVTCPLAGVRVALLPACFEDDDERAICWVITLKFWKWAQPAMLRSILTDKCDHGIRFKLLLFWLACEITPQVFLYGNLHSAICLSLRVKLRPKEQEP